jgi:glutathione S-transferase
VVRDGLPFLFDGFTIADVDLALTRMRLIRAGDEVPARLAAWAEALWLRPSVREHVEHPRPPHPPG